MQPPSGHHLLKDCWTQPIGGLIIPAGLIDMPVSPLAWRTGGGLCCYQAVTCPRWMACPGDQGIIPSSLWFSHSFPCAVGTATILAAPRRDAYSPWGIKSLHFHTQGQAGKKSHILCESGARVHVRCTVTLWLHQAVMWYPGQIPPASACPVFMNMPKGNLVLAAL